jgi:hypothetical protein
MSRLRVRQRRDRGTELDGSSGEQVLMKRHHYLRNSSISTSENDACKKYM